MRPPVVIERNKNIGIRLSYVALKHLFAIKYLYGTNYASHTLKK